MDHPYRAERRASISHLLVAMALCASLATFLATPAVAQGNFGNDATYIAQEVPTQMVAGRSYLVTITVQNTGTTTWTEQAKYALGTQASTDAWLTPRVAMNVTEAVQPGDTRTFPFVVTAPSTAGAYPFQWQMVQDAGGWFGSMTPSLLVQVIAAAPGNDAMWLSTTLHDEVNPGTLQVLPEETFTAHIKVKNTGTTTWTGGAFELRSWAPELNSTWGVERVTLDPSESIEPADSKELVFVVSAPLEPGDYGFQWRMNDGSERGGGFGELTPKILVTVAVPVDMASCNDAAYISQRLNGVPDPTTLCLSPNQQFPVEITMKNTGTCNWTTNDYKLGVQNPQDNGFWGTQRIYLSPPDVPPGTQRTLTKTLRAPSAPGTYNFQWRMVQEGVEWFGALSRNVTVTVGSCGGCASSCPAANPNDGVADNNAIQACLDSQSEVRLCPGSRGYILDHALNPRSNQILTSAVAPTKANLVAGNNLNGPMIEVLNRTDFTIKYLTLNGSRQARAPGMGRAHCCTGDPSNRNAGKGIRVGSGNRFTIEFVDIADTLCGSAMEILGSNFTVRKNTIRRSGYDCENFDEAWGSDVCSNGAGPEPWADGITIWRCFNGTVEDNVVEDSTDVGIVTGGTRQQGTNGTCTIRRNRVANTSGQKAIAEFHLGYFQSGGGNHRNTTVTQNSFVANPGGRASAGHAFVAGGPPWNPGSWPELSGGSVTNNEMLNGKTNITIDYVRNSTINYNSFTGNTALNQPPCWFGYCNSYGATVHEVTNVCYDHRSIGRCFHAGGGCDCNEHQDVDVPVCPIRVQLAPDETPPAVSVFQRYESSPALTRELGADAIDADSGVSSVALYVDGELVATRFSHPYDFLWDTSDVAPGLHEFRAVAFNGDDVAGDAAMEVSIP